MPELYVTGLSIAYDTGDGLSAVVDDVSFTVQSGERLGIAGESGSGKSTILLAVLGLVASAAHVSGSITWDGRELLDASERELYAVRGKQIGYVPQAAINSLNPVATVRRQIAEILPSPDGGRRQRRRGADGEIARLLDEVGLPGTTADRYPHQLSGGMRQRVIIAMALAQRPQLLLADEPTTALDVIVQSEVLDLLSALCAEHGISLMIVSHELAVLAGVTDRMVVMRYGRVVEAGTAAQIFRAAEHPYTRQLVEASRVSSTPVEVVDA